MSAGSDARPLRVCGGEVVTGDGTRHTDVRMVGDRIVAEGLLLDPVDEQVIDARGLRVCPGFVDLQVNGGVGIDLARWPDRMGELAVDLVTHGVTTFLPTIVSSPPERVGAACAAWADHRDGGSDGAVPVGLHLEGPMLSPGRAGAHDPVHLSAPSADLIADWSSATGVRLVTLAPELPGALDVIETLVDRGITVSLGHSAADVAEVAAAVEAGASLVTHLFNAMGPLHHRAPGLPGAALVDERLRAGIIVDGVHVHADVVRLACAALGPDRLVLVSDGAPARGVATGPVSMGTSRAELGDDGIRTPEGVLAGADLTLDRAVRNLAGITGDWVTAVRAASAVPAAAVDLADRGVVAPGRRADLALLDDELRVVLTVVGGRVVYDPRGLAS